MMFAKNKHMDQKRKYTNEPYFVHLAEVAALVETVSDNRKLGASAEVMIAASWCHDTIEDQGVTHKDLTCVLGAQVATGVLHLSDLETGNRSTRKQLARDRLSAAPAWIQTIKVADLYSNTPSIVAHDPEFAKVYVSEVCAYLDVLTLADTRLRDLLAKSLKDYTGK
jgi:(p)ppGpp synthase/HD superfamily hydrolase